MWLTSSIFIFLRTSSSQLPSGTWHLSFHILEELSVTLGWGGARACSADRQCLKIQEKGHSLNCNKLHQTSHPFTAFSFLISPEPETRWGPKVLMCPLPPVHPRWQAVDSGHLRTKLHSAFWSIGGFGSFWHSFALVARLNLCCSYGSYLYLSVSWGNNENIYILYNYMWEYVRMPLTCLKLS